MWPQQEASSGEVGDGPDQARDALLLLGAGLACIYGLDAASAFALSPIQGAVLIAIALMQGSWLWAARELSRRALIAAVALNLALIALWVVSRTMGLPVGPRGAQPVGVLDTLCTIDSVAVVALAIGLAGVPVRLITLATRGLQTSAIVLTAGSLSALGVSAHAQSLPARAGQAPGAQHHFFCQLL